MKDLELKLLEICGNDEKVFEKVKIEVFGLIQNPEMFENVEIEFSYTPFEINPRKKKDLEILDVEIFSYIYPFLKEMGYKSVRTEKFEDYYTQYFKK
ncbi:hypothetical protein [Fusobacterium periodonticum]|uniref:Uncharacterized protein n=1 Tax=Fusobacterium periodonticum ATCC 33693 TaxID=546275 RepID=D4CXT8_9FUSO|nr:hypothetical protein [Fusobacterium periodonticum]EFE85837.1 hypothetical protein FUSPEROL_02195 [Fusobacterium periodonticum ATCC 33693]